MINIRRPFGAATAHGLLWGLKNNSDPTLSAIVTASTGILKETLNNGVGPWKYEELDFSKAAATTGTAPPGAKPLPFGDATLRVVVGSK
jgi:hypothetical protein